MGCDLRTGTFAAHIAIAQRIGAERATVATHLLDGHVLLYAMSVNTEVDLCSACSSNSDLR